MSNFGGKEKELEGHDLHVWLRGFLWRSSGFLAPNEWWLSNRAIRDIAFKCHTEKWFSPFAVVVVHVASWSVKQFSKLRNCVIMQFFDAETKLTKDAKPTTVARVKNISADSQTRIDGKSISSTFWLLMIVASISSFAKREGTRVFPV